MAQRLKALGKFTYTIANFRKVLNGTHLKLPEVELFKARQVSISSSQAGALTPDGEVPGSTPVTIRYEQSSLPVFWPTNC